MNIIKQIVDSIKRIQINGYSEKLICTKCGKEYQSTGKKDPGICKECMIFSGGPLDGQKVGDLYDETGS